MSHQSSKEMFSAFPHILKREFISLPSFDEKWKKLELNEIDRQKLENALIDNPKVGDVIRGTKGARKMRYAFENQGKSSSARVIYVDFEVMETIYLIDVYAKAKKDNLTKEEINELKQVVEILKA